MITDQGGEIEKLIKNELETYEIILRACLRMDRPAMNTNFVRGWDLGFGRVIVSLSIENQSEVF